MCKQKQNKNMINGNKSQDKSNTLVQLLHVYVIKTTQQKTSLINVDIKFLKQYNRD